MRGTGGAVRGRERWRWRRSLLVLPRPGAQDAARASAELNSGDTAWMLMSTALVLLMTPALAFFYGGLVRSKNALNTMMMSFISLGFVGVAWAAASATRWRCRRGKSVDRRHCRSPS